MAEQVKLLHGKNGKKNPIFEAVFEALRWTQITAIGKGTFSLSDPKEKHIPGYHLQFFPPKYSLK